MEASKTGLVVNADGVVESEGSTRATERARALGVTGVTEHGTLREGLPRNLGDPVVSGRPVPTTRGTTEAGRDGRREVGAPHSTGEAGEPTRGTRWREGGAGLRNRRRER